MHKGDLVRLKCYTGERYGRFLEDKGDTVVACLEEEFISAEREHRLPKGVGYHRRYVVEAVDGETNPRRDKAIAPPVLVREGSRDIGPGTARPS